MMKYSGLLASTLLAGTSAFPLSPQAGKGRDVQQVNLRFHGAAATYTMSFPADGVEHRTNNLMSVAVIEAPDYNAYSQCVFRSAGDAQVTFTSSISPDGTNLVLVGPPQAIVSVKCEGMCVPNYSDCYANGQPVGPCCNGYCAANKCRPWNLL